MSKLLPYYVVNAFAEEPLGGNPAGVFLEPNSLGDEEMQLIAKQLNLVETVFVLPPSSKEADIRLRYFTPHKELPIAGHPTISTWVALALEKRIDLSKSRPSLKKRRLAFKRSR